MNCSSILEDDIINIMYVPLNKLPAVVNAVFAVLAILGIVTDPTTEGVSDSKQAMTYEMPKKKNAN